jgi:argininosuccinate lyase
MSRFAEPQHPDFQRLNASIGFDWRLGPYDVEQSRAHARMLAAAGIISDEDRDALLRGLDQVAGELDSGSFPFLPDDEDIHMAVERRLTEIAGPVGGRLHTARSRNDQVATDVAMYTRAHALQALEGLWALQAAVLEVAERHLDWPMPGYTHLQRAQPVYLSHHLLAYFWMFGRDARRFRLVLDGTNDLPLGAGALAGVNFATDRGMLARELGFAAVAPNSIDAVSNRDFVLDYLAAAATCATHLSRLGAEIVLWSSEEFGFCEVSDAWASGSSIMPQKKNPDAAELLRAKAPRVVGHFVALQGVMHGLPLTYNKDMQEDKEHLFDCVDTLELCLSAARGMLDGMAFRRERLAGAASDEMIAATDVADLLVRRGVPFRQSHGIVAGLVREAVESGRTLSQLTREDLARHADVLDEEYYAVLSQRSWLESKVSEGGTALARVREQLERARADHAAAAP